jgi:DnaJ-class molecular chaperone
MIRVCRHCDGSGHQDEEPSWPCPHCAGWGYFHSHHVIYSRGGDSPTTSAILDKPSLKRK